MRLATKCYSVKCYNTTIDNYAKRCVMSVRTSSLSISTLYNRMQFSLLQDNYSATKICYLHILTSYHIKFYRQNIVTQQVKITMFRYQCLKYTLHNV